MPYIGNSPKNNVRGRFYYTATAAQTVFSGADSNGKTLAYQDGGYVDVYLNGVLLQDTTDYTATTKTSVTLTSGATAGDLVEIIAYGIFSVGDTVSAANGGTFKGNVAINADLTVDTNTLYVDSTNNRVGIGTASPASVLHLSTSNDPIITLTDTGFGASADITGSNGNLRLNSQTATIFDMADSEVARIDSSGNLLMGKTSSASTVVGAELNSSGRVLGVRDGAEPFFANRLTSDGMIARFQKDGSTVGSIGTYGSTTFIQSGASASYAGLLFNSNSVEPARANGTSGSDPRRDNVLDLGSSSYRFDDIYATNSTIQTSDANEKQQIAVLTDAEITAAKAISKLFKTFKWNDKVAEKGDAARTHTGVIAQEVQQAMTDAGLDVGNYAFFTSATWWEVEEVLPATDEYEEHTVTHQFATLEEAPEGATERTRLGIRYPELLAFIGAATEQRLASIEARLDALEAV